VVQAQRGRGTKQGKCTGLEKKVGQLGGGYARGQRIGLAGGEKTMDGGNKKSQKKKTAGRSD